MFIHLRCPLELWVRIATRAYIAWADSGGTLSTQSFWRVGPQSRLYGTSLGRSFTPCTSPPLSGQRRRRSFYLWGSRGGVPIQVPYTWVVSPGRFSLEREKTAQFVLGLHISLRVIVAIFSCAALTEAIMRALHCEHAHDLRHQTKGTTPFGNKRQKNNAENQ